MYVVYFLNQKTAYEMRISDWSSDVCSSDLHRRHLTVRGSAMVKLARLCAVGTFQIMVSTTAWIALIRLLVTFGSVVVAGFGIAMRSAVIRDGQGCVRTSSSRLPSEHDNKTQDMCTSEFTQHKSSQQ